MFSAQLFTMSSSDTDEDDNDDKSDCQSETVMIQIRVVFATHVVF